MSIGGARKKQHTIGLHVGWITAKHKDRDVLIFHNIHTQTYFVVSIWFERHGLLIAVLRVSSWNERNTETHTNGDTEASFQPQLTLLLSFDYHTWKSLPCILSFWKVIVLNNVLNSCWLQLSETVEISLIYSGQNTVFVCVLFLL